ncbi:MAG: S9 family peptidase [Promethearchaeota archaeon]
MSPKDPEIKPPVAKIVPKKFTVHNEEIIDNYYWLREKSNPEVIEYLEAENKYTEAMMQHTKEFQEKLYKEMLSKIKETDLTVPDKIGDYFYYSRTEKGKQYRIFCRKKGSLKAKEEVLLDLNELAKGHKYFNTGIIRISPNHQLLSYSVDTNGSEEYTLYIKDLETGKLLEDIILKTSYSAEWANDNRTLFYTTLSEEKRPYKLFRHTVGSEPKDDVLIYHEEDDAYFLYVAKTKDKKYLLMTLKSTITSEVHYLSTDHPNDNFRLVHPREPELEYYIAHHGGKFYVLTNDQAKNFRLMEVSITEPTKTNWKEVIPHRKSVRIEGIEAFKNHLVIYERENGLKKIYIKNLITNESHYVEFPEAVYDFSSALNPEFDSNLLRFLYTSLVTPDSVFDYNMDTKERELKKQREVLGGYDTSHYQSERIFATAQDGTKVYISLVYKKGKTRNGKNPLYLYGYGAYGISEDPFFSSTRLSLLDRGFIYAIAHVRGGEEMGREWYEQGKLLNKINTFTDFIACAEHLIAEKYTSPDYLVIQGGSAGGLLIGAVVNMRPDLFKAVIAKVPFVDVINTMLDPTIPLTVIEFDEWGNPEEKKYYEYIKSYSPYDNVEAKDYPTMLITAGLNDPRVQYWEPAKWVAKLRVLKTDNNPLFLKMDMGVGHGGASGRYDFLKDIAFDYVFIFDVLGIKE